MDISNITDITKLKAMVYDQLLMKDEAERNISTLNNRIAALYAQDEGAPEQGQAPAHTHTHPDDGLPPVAQPAPVADASKES